MLDHDRTHSAQVLAREVSGPPVPHLMVAWSADQPELTGYTTGVPRPALLGRGPSAPDDPAPRLSFCAERPQSPKPGPDLAGAQISRRQILLAPLAGAALSVKSVGRHPLYLNGEVVTEGIARPGDTLRVLNSLVLLVLARPPFAVAAQRPAEPLTFELGEADGHGMVGESLAIWKLREAVRFAAQANQHVLVQGESGSGKELVARALHAQSARRHGPFVARNAATLPEGLVDAELFGSVRGYPHATSPERPGLIGAAECGTLFLDEMAELAHDLQAHLLRVLDDGGDYQRLGESRRRRANVRLVAATNRPLEALKHDFAARFRLRLTVPSLNDRREDIPFLLRQLFARAVREHPELGAAYGNRDAMQLSTALDPALVEALLLHRYTHHLRELDQLLWLALSTGPTGRVELTPEVQKQLHATRVRANGVETGVGMSRGALGEVSAAPAAAFAAPASAPKTEREAIESALAQTGGKVAPAARLLGLGSRHALYRLMEKHGIHRPAGQGNGEEEG